MKLSIRHWLDERHQKRARQRARHLVQRAIAAEQTGLAGSLGDPMQAIASLKHAISLDPEYGLAHYHLGLALFRAGHHADAISSFRDALQLDGPYAESSLGLASALESLGRADEALQVLESCIARNDGHAAAHFQVAMLLRHAGRTDEAIARDRCGLELEPEQHAIHCRLGHDLAALGRRDEAEASYQRALAFNPDYTEAQIGLARLLSRQGHQVESLRLLFDVAARHPESDDARQSLLDHLRDVPLTSAGTVERDVLVQLCADESVSARTLTPAIVSLLTSAPGFARLQRCEDFDDALRDLHPDVQEFLNDSLVLAALPRIYVMDAGLERVLTRLRRSLLLRLEVTDGGNANVLPPFHHLTCAIAGQCFFMGFAFFVSQDEALKLGVARAAVASMLAQKSIEPAAIEPALAVVAMYECLDAVPGSERSLGIPSTGWSAAFQLVLRKQVEDRRRERAIQREIATTAAIDDEVSQAVRRQYHEQPYPVWTGLDAVKSQAVEALSKRLRPDRPALVSARRYKILVAGCGTGEHPIQVARTYPECEVLAIDLSVPSLCYAKRMTEQFGLSNLTYRQADILDLDRLGERFTLIECCGVLHHLSDPVRGWRMLVDLLDPGGMMRVGLYSARARREIGVAAAREFARAGKFPQSADGVRSCRHAIMALPDGHPAKAVLQCGDFYSTNGCRDLIMHTQEDEFTLPRVAECLEELGLRFLGMECSPETASRFRALFPDGASAVDLAAWDRFEHAYPSTFKGMYLFWCERR